MVTFFHQCVIHAIEFQAQEPSRALGKKLDGFKDIVIQDSSIIRLHEFLSDKWPAARSRKAAAGVKVSCVVSAIANGPKSVKYFQKELLRLKHLKLVHGLKIGYFLLILDSLNMAFSTKLINVTVILLAD